MVQVLVPFDGSQQSRHALEFACEKFNGEDIAVLFVVDTSITLQPETYTGMKLGEIYESREEAGREHLDEASAIASTFDMSVTTVLKHGEPSKVILRQVEEQDADHVVIGSQSQGLLERYFLGSVAERVVERAPVSVSVIRD
jgi:nucleotide-binding universal stress UspA family protein